MSLQRNRLPCIVCSWELGAVTGSLDRAVLAASHPQWPCASVPLATLLATWGSPVPLLMGPVSGSAITAPGRGPRGQSRT